MLAQENTVSEAAHSSRRGNILDVRGNLLASSTMVKNLCADPTLIGESAAGCGAGHCAILEIEGGVFPESCCRGHLCAMAKRISLCRIKKVPVETWVKRFSRR